MEPEVIKADKATGDQSVLLSKEFKLRFKEPGPAIYSNNMLVQRDETVVYVSFYQTIPPLMVGDEATIRAAVDSLDTIEAMPIVRVAFPLGKLEALIGALKTVQDTMADK